MPPPEGTFSRCEKVTFIASYTMPAVTLPWIGGFGSGIAVRARHTEIVDPFRNGVPGSNAPCFE